MSPRQHLRELISDRLAVAAEEIFRAFESTISVYEEELERQRELFEVERKAHDVPQQQGCKKEVRIDQHLNDQEENPSLDHVEPESLNIKEDDDEIPISQEEQLVLMQEAGTLTMTLDNGESSQIKAEHGSDHQNIKAWEDVDYQKELQDFIWHPQINVHRLEPPQLDVCEEDILTDAQLYQQHKNQNHQKISISQKDLSLKDSTIVLTHNEESDHRETETDRDHQHLSPVAERHDQTEMAPRESGSSPETHPERTRQNKEQYHQSNIGFSTRKKNGSIKCESCGKTFTSRYRLKVHQRIHTGEKPYSCEFCGKRYYRKDMLENHTRIHTGEKPFSSGKQFIKSENLEGHVNSEKPFSCETCGKCFTQRRNLEGHMKTHTNEELFPCETCGKRFIRRTHLKVHMRIHTGDRPFTCEMCGKCFSQRGTKTRHMRTHRGETVNL